MSGEQPPQDTLADFIGSLARRLTRRSNDVSLPPEPEAIARQVAPAPDEAGNERLVARFVQAATDAGACVHRAANADWLETLAQLVQGRRPRALLLPPIGDGFFDAERVAQLARRLAAPGLTLHEPGAVGDDELFAADLAITGVAAAIAETGTIVCASGPHLRRMASLAPPVHIAVVGTDQLLPDVCDCFGALGDWPQRPAAVSLITGPSKTADIEGILVTGVHGPGELHLLLVR